MAVCLLSRDIGIHENGALVQQAQIIDSDEALMVRYQKGDIPAFNALVRRFHAKVLAFALRMVGSMALAEEVAAETFLRLHRAAARYEPKARFTSYLFAIAYRESINVIRRRAPFLKTQRGGVAGSPGVDPPCTGASPEAQVAHREHLALVDKVVEGLPMKQRAVFLLYHREGLSTPEIAEALDMPVGSVRAYLTRARGALRQALIQKRASHLVGRGEMP